MVVKVSDKVLEAVALLRVALPEVRGEDVVVDAEDVVEVRVPELEVGVQVDEVDEVVGRVAVVDQLVVDDDQVLRVRLVLVTVLLNQGKSWKKMSISVKLASF